MNFDLTPAQLDLRTRAAGYVDDVLIPLEVEAELALGRLPEEVGRRVRREARERGLDGGTTHPNTAVGGGRTWSSRWCTRSWGVTRTRSGGTWAAPTTCCRGALRSRSSATCCRRCAASGATPTRSRRSTPAPTPAGSRARRARTATASGMRAEKWFVTTGDKADYFIVMVNVVEEDARLPTLFLVDRDFRASSSSTTRRSPTTSPTAIRRPLRRAAAGERRAGRPRAGRPGRRAPERVVRRGAAPHRGPLCRRDAPPAPRDGRVVARPPAVRLPDLRLPGRLLPAGRLGGRCRGGPAAGLPGGRPGRRPASTASWCTPTPRWPSCSPARRPGAAPTAASRPSAAAATCAPTSPSASSASCGSTASGRAPARSSGYRRPWPRAPRRGTPAVRVSPAEQRGIPVVPPSWNTPRADT